MGARCQWQKVVGHTMGILGLDNDRLLGFSFLICMSHSLVLHKLSNQIESICSSVAMDLMMRNLRKLDSYPKTNKDFYSRRTISGGIITLVSAILMLILFISELRLYLLAVTETKLVVNTSRGETLRINFDITFPALACSVVSLDEMDISGEQHFDVRHDIIKKRIDTHGNVIKAWQDGIGAPKMEKPLQRHGGRLEHNETYCGTCYGPEASDEDCCNSCEEVREAYQKKGWGLSNPDLIDQCKREGFLKRIKDEEGEGCNIYGFLEVNKVAGNFHFAPGQSFQQSNTHIHDLLVFQKDCFNFSITEHFRGAEVGFAQSIPGVTFMEQHVSFLHFLTNVCAIVGGIFTVSGILDSFIYHGQKAMKKKMELGKFS
ncbi:endoplasmic reticulum-Golgi intermediate compartment protein 3 [Cinnamomum micranthum f. kanehirae]|uniref:Endoplasmic reticulum-Golgi intermediate compartment protein 3 n=1 Tax=Cinnamomum micranthum f. kanehirae TaxID=337451 RepID=A0A3S3P498_9MAGN|nr:endoplasmic reticulum-Golgi intermediate compartment protein 3 [Cinnamomum micranthum f. kanehirae]